MFRKLFILELKKNIRQLPFVCLAGAILAFFIGGLVFFAVRIYESDNRLLDVRMAVVSETPDDPYLDMILGYVDAVSGSSEDYTFSISGSNFEKNRQLVMYSKHMVLTLQMMEEEEAREELKDGTSLAILYLPANLTYDILAGNQTSIRIELGPVNTLDALMTTELSNALSLLLRAAQADDYAISDLYESLGISDETNDAMLRMDLINGIHVAQRGYLYDTKLITPGGLTDLDSSAMRTLLYFASCGLILLLFFTFVVFSPALSAESDEFYEILGAEHLPFSEIRYVLCKFGANLLVNGAFLSVLWSIAYLIASGKGIDLLPSFGGVLFVFWLSAALIASICVFLFLAFRSAPAAILTWFCGIIGMCFASGYFLPSAYLPGWLAKLGSVFPTSHLLDLWNKEIGFPSSDTTPYILLWILLFTAFSVASCHFERRTDS